MCREFPGPRCSNSAKNRYLRAQQNLEKITEKFESSISPTPELDYKYRQAQARMEQATLHWHATPAGWKELEEQSARYTQEYRNSTQLSERLILRAKYQATENMLQAGRQRRQDAYADYARVQRQDADRNVLRQESLNRGGHQGPNGHPLSEENAARLRQTPQRIELTPYTIDDVQRANSWVEESSHVQYTDNTKVRPPKKAMNDLGIDVPVGEKIDNEPATSRIVRLNMPDGNVVEGRHDIFITRTENGSYNVISRHTTGSTWEDSSPIQRTQRKLGELISGSDIPGITVRREAQLVGTATTLEEARTLREAEKENFQLYQATALAGRDNLVRRAKRADLSLQIRGNETWHRHNPVE